MTDTANAPERIWAYPDYPDWSETGGWADHKDGWADSELLTEYVLSTHCDELVTAARAEGAREAQAKIARLTEALAIAGPIALKVFDYHLFTLDAEDQRKVETIRAALQENANG